MAFRRKRLIFRRMALTRIVSLSFGLFVAVAILLVLYMSVAANYANTFSLLNDKAILIMQNMGRRVRVQLNLVEEATVSLKSLIEEKQIDIDDTDVMLRQLTAASASNSFIDVLVVTDLKGDKYGVMKAENGKLWPFRRQIPSNGRQMYRLPKMQPGAGPTWGPLVRNNAGFYANVSVPLLQDGKLIGYLTAGSSIVGLEQAIESMDEGPNTTTFIMLESGLVIAHSDMSQFMTGEQPASALPTSRESLDDPVLMNLPGEPMTEYKRASELGIEVSRIEAKGSRFLMMRLPIRGYSSEPWVVGEYFRAATSSREMRRLAGSVVVGIGAMFVAVLIAIWFGRRVTRPLHVIAEEAERVGRLAFSEVQPLPRSQVKEIDQMARAFNAMVVGLRAMNTYVPQSLFRKLMRLGLEDAARPREAELTMMFTDIVGFTTLSESVSAVASAQILNDHFSILVAAVEKEGGTVDKFIGDGMLAFWGAPDPRPDHAEAAVRTASKIACALREYNRISAAEGAPQIRLRIGIHTGQVVVGNVGALDRWNYTIVGDAVNVCERLQSLGRDIGSSDEVTVLVSEATETLLPDELPCEAMGTYQLRGREGDIAVWKVNPYDII